MVDKTKQLDDMEEEDEDADTDADQEAQERPDARGENRAKKFNSDFFRKGANLKG